MYTSRLDLGTFDVVSGKLMITDPCYKSDLWCANSVGQVRKGAGNALAVTADTGEMGGRI